MHNKLTSIIKRLCFNSLSEDNYVTARKKLWSAAFTQHPSNRRASDCRCLMDRIFTVLHLLSFAVSFQTHYPTRHSPPVKGQNNSPSKQSLQSAMSASTSAGGSPGPAGPSFWNEKYSNKEEFAYGTEPNDFLKQIIPTLNLSKGSKCLMLADGEGRNGVYMAQLGHDVTSVDYSTAGIEKTKQLAESKSVTVEAIEADLATFDLGENKWDCIVGIFCHFPPPIRSKILDAIPVALKKEGRGYFVLECYTPEQLEYKTGGPPVAALMYSREILGQAFETKLEIQKNEELVRDVVEGTLHTGKAAVVQFVGRKP